MKVAPPIVSGRSGTCGSRWRLWTTILLLLLVTRVRVLYGSWSSVAPSLSLSVSVSAPVSSPSSSYRGSQYWKEGVTQSVQTLYETPFARFQMHQVSVGGRTISDWLWFDECDNVNVLVQHANGKFWVLEQTKYAIKGTTYSVVGGMIEGASDASPLAAAQREVKEELQLESADWISLGSFVAASNRGGGTTHTFWARQARPVRPNPHQTTTKVDGIAEGELERQDVVQLSRSALLDALLAGKFQEIKWTATIALALLQSPPPTDE